MQDTLKQRNHQPLLAYSTWVSHQCHWPPDELPDPAAGVEGHCHVSIVQTDHTSILHVPSPTGGTDTITEGTVTMVTYRFLAFKAHLFFANWTCNLISTSLIGKSSMTFVLNNKRTHDDIIWDTLITYIGTPTELRICGQIMVPQLLATYISYFCSTKLFHLHQHNT